ncbi:MAG: hypothetical protein OHK0017_00720 [Patescibacteria group bacterium]
MIIHVKVKTGAKFEKLVSLNGADFQAWVKSPATEGKANHALVRLLAREFKIGISQIKIITGYNIPFKKILINK